MRQLQLAEKYVQVIRGACFLKALGVGLLLSAGSPQETNALVAATFGAVNGRELTQTIESARTEPSMNLADS